jgi:osmotically-inducible protein OsmY
MNNYSKLIAMICVAFAAIAPNFANAGQQQNSTDLDQVVSTAIKGIGLEHPDDMHFTVQDHDVTLTGWARSPNEVKNTMQAVAKLPGVNHVYGNKVRTWSK